MPTYEYECPEHGIFEEEHSIKIKLEFCPKCKEDGKETPIKRLISLGGKGVVELYGRDLIDKCKADAKQIMNEAHQNTNKYANLIGDAKYDDLQTKLDKRRK